MIRTRIVGGIAAMIIASACAGAEPARADFGITGIGGSATSLDGSFSRQAGAHPDLTVKLAFATKQPPGAPQPVPDGNVRDIEVALPAGVTGNPTAVPTCPHADLNANGQIAKCRAETQVGVVRVDQGSVVLLVGLYNIEHGPDLPGLFGFNFGGAIATIVPRVRPDDYGISAMSVAISQALPVYGVEVTMWGVPADAVHDPDRIDGAVAQQGVPSTAPRRPLMTSPTSCPSTPATTTARVSSWDDPGRILAASFDSDFDGTPFLTEGCERLPFDPSIDVQPLSRTADAPTGLVVDLTVPQSDAPDGLATAHVKRVEVRLPEGMSVSPSSAAGLGACAPGEIKLGSNEAPACPDSSKLGTIEVDTPLLEDPLAGDIILAKPDDNPFGSLLAIYLVAEGPGFWLKLPGRVDADPVTGRLTTTFDNNPQLPFSRLRVAFRGGSQAPLATPPACGAYTTHTEITSWASDMPVSVDSPMTIDEGCAPRDFAPAMTAGTTNPLAGAESPFSLTLTRSDRSQYLSRIETSLPPGLLARIASVPQCPEPLATSGGCAAGTEIGHTTVLAGPGAAPLPVRGRVYLTGPYRDAPFGMSIVVPTAGQAGPFDLGVVVVRAGIYVDRTDAHVTVKSDPLPTILRGFPLRLRQVNVTIDRPGFMFNPTSCGATAIGATLGSLEGAARQLTVPFRVGGCAALDVDQKLAMRFTGRRQTTDGKHPGVSATVTSKGGGANLGKAVVKLPLSVALDPDNAQALCKPAERAALACPRASIVGRATASSILPHPLVGPVYFVEGTRVSSTGRIIRTLPKLWIPLSADGVTVDLDASSDVDSRQRLVTTFDNLPDAPFSSFRLDIDGGRHGILVVSGRPGTCDRSRTIDAQFTGQNRKAAERAVQAGVEGCKLKVAKSSSNRRSVTVRIAGLSAGRLTLRGTGVRKVSRALGERAAITVSAPLTPTARGALRRNGRVRVKLAARHEPQAGKARTVRTTITVKR
jgi:hypothetical protein